MQGVGYRWFARAAARRLGLSGWVKNLTDGGVEAEAQGGRETLGEFVRELRAGPPWAEVTEVSSVEIPPGKADGVFEIH